VVTGSWFDESRVPRNLGAGQRDYPDRNILGPGKTDGIGEKDHIHTAPPVQWEFTFITITLQPPVALLITATGHVVQVRVLRT
jgi:hypothetical protein